MYAGGTKPMHEGARSLDYMTIRPYGVCGMGSWKFLEKNWRGDFEMGERSSEGRFRLLHGDCREVMLREGPFDMILADPPYGDTSLSWDKRVKGWEEVAMGADQAGAGGGSPAEGRLF